MEFLQFFVFFTIFWKKKYRNSEKITPSFNRFHSQILLNDFGFWDFSIDLRYVGSYGKIPNPSKSSPVGLWKRLIDFLPTCHKGLHDHLRSVMSMHFWRFFFSLFLTFLNFLCQLDHRRITCFEEKNSNKFLVQVASAPSTVEKLRHLILRIQGISS